jgi:N-acetyl-gamma-glutamyl-phosphate reductase
MGGRVRVVVAGATGYSGRELIRIILSHREWELVGAFSSRVEEGRGAASARSRPLSEIHPELSGQTGMVCQPFDEAVLAALDPGLIFLATPNEFSHEVVPALLASGATVVDLSGAYRLQERDLYPSYYGFAHQHSDLLPQAVYGLTELVRDRLPGARLIANPGCYPTSIVLAVAPLLEAGLVDLSQPIICDSKSGVTGAGKAATSTTHFVEVNESFRAYNLFRHRHTPEIAQGLGLALDAGQLIFTPHLLPINRGILSTIYLRLRPGIGRADLVARWEATYHDSPFVRLFPETQLPEIKFVAGQPYCDLGATVDERSGQAILVGAIDNLLKGAASQAVQNANLALGMPEAEGLR